MIRPLWVPSERPPKIRFPYQRKKPYIPSKPKRGRAMTISLGFRAYDGILLCSDRQLTVQGSHKYYDSKFRELKGKSWGIVFNYAWFPEMMNLFFETVQDRFSVDTPPNLAEAKDEIADIADTLYKQHKDFRVQQMLCAVSLPNDVLFLRINGKVVIDATPVEYLGVGDSSLIRFLTPLLVSKEMSAYRAAKVAIYIVTQANYYIDGCGGGPDTRFVQAGGKVADHGGFNELEGIEEALQNVFEHRGTAYLDQRLSAFGQEVKTLYRNEELQSSPRPIIFGEKSYPSPT